MGLGIRLSIVYPHHKSSHATRAASKAISRGTAQHQTPTFAINANSLVIFHANVQTLKKALQGLPPRSRATDALQKDILPETVLLIRPVLSAINASSQAIFLVIVQFHNAGNKEF